MSIRWVRLESTFGSLSPFVEQMGTPIAGQGSSGALDAAILRLASWMTEPVCQISELKGRLHLVKEMHSSRLVWMAARVWIVAKICLYVLPALALSVPAMVLRQWFRCRSSGLWRTGRAEQKQWPDNTLSMLTWNICAPAGQYSITDGGVLPWRERAEAVVARINEARAQLVCLSEVFDAAAALQMAEVLSETYAHVLIAVGQRAVGVPSGMVIASEGPLERVAFEAYPKEWLDSRTKNAEKGILSFTVPLAGKKLTVLTSHLQHSEQPEFPTQDELKCRQQQLGRLEQLAQQAVDRNEGVVITGDLNLEPTELFSDGRQDRFDQAQASQEPTWGGDSWCAASQDKQGSQPLTLDYTLGWNGSVQRIETVLIETGFRGDQFLKGALSDHRGLLSTITVGRMEQALSDQVA